MTTSMRSPLWPVRFTVSGTLTFIHEVLLVLNDSSATSAVPPMADSRSEPLTVPDPGFTQIVAM